MQTFITKSAEQTQKLARDLAQKFKDRRIFALSGPLGSGKTTFTQGFAQTLDIKEQLLSPTFVLIRAYSLPNKKKGKLYHIDLYRLDRKMDVRYLGVEEIMGNPENIILIEWAEKMKSLLPKDAIFITFKTISEEEREIIITQSGVGGDVQEQKS